MTTNDPLQEAENILRQEAERLSQAQSQEHQRTQPFLYTEARRMIAAGNRNHLYCHLFVITEEQAPEGQTAANPLNIAESEAMTAAIRLTHSFQTKESAVKALSDTKAQIVINELRKVKECALYLFTQDGLAVMIAGDKLTVTKRNKDRQYDIQHTSLTTEAPQTFFGRCGTSDDENQLISTLVALLHAGRVMEQEAPNQYRLVFQRLGDAFDDFLGKQDDE